MPSDGQRWATGCPERLMRSVEESLCLVLVDRAEQGWSAELVDSCRTELPGLSSWSRGSPAPGFASASVEVVACEEVITGSSTAMLMAWS